MWRVSFTSGPEDDAAFAAVADTLAKARDRCEVAWVACGVDCHGRYFLIPAQALNCVRTVAPEATISRPI